MLDRKGECPQKRGRDSLRAHREQGDLCEGCLQDPWESTESLLMRRMALKSDFLPDLKEAELRYLPRQNVFAPFS